MELAGDGMAFLPMWGISVKAFTLPTAEAEAMAALVASTRNLEDEPVPATQSDEGPLGKYARADGSLREEYTEPRRTEGNDPSSMLPDADEVYLATAATTTEDLAAAAPSVPEEVRAEIAALDPTLDQDVADWFDESSPRPKVHLLGPVSVTALNGGDPAAIDNAGGTVSFIAYLAVQDQGVTGERAAVACGWKTQKTVQNRATNARFLLGTRPDGSDWLPDASMSAGARRGTSPDLRARAGDRRGAQQRRPVRAAQAPGRAPRRQRLRGGPGDRAVVGRPVPRSRRPPSTGSSGCSSRGSSGATRSWSEPSTTRPTSWRRGRSRLAGPTWSGWPATRPGRPARTVTSRGWIRPRPPRPSPVATPPASWSASRSSTGSTRTSRRARRPSWNSASGVPPGSPRQAPNGLLTTASALSHLDGGTGPKPVFWSPTGGPQPFGPNSF